MSPATAVLAASDTGKGSPIGLFVMLLLIVAVYLLYRSMSSRLRRLPERFPGYGSAGADGADGAGTDGAGADGITSAAATSTGTGTGTSNATGDDTAGRNVPLASPSPSPSGQPEPPRPGRPA